MLVWVINYCWPQVPYYEISIGNNAYLPSSKNRLGYYLDSRLNLVEQIQVKQQAMMESKVLQKDINGKCPSPTK